MDLLGDRQRKLNLQLRSFRSEPRFRFACFAPYSPGACTPQCAPLVYYLQFREKLKRSLQFYFVRLLQNSEQSLQLSEVEANPQL